MTITVEPHIGVDLGEKKIIPDTNELVLDGGFSSSKMLKVSLLLIVTSGGNRQSALGSLISQKSFYFYCSSDSFAPLVSLISIFSTLLGFVALGWRFICSARLPPFSLLHSHRPPDVFTAARLAGNIRRASRILSRQPATRPELLPWDQLPSSLTRALRHYSVSQHQTPIKEDGGFSVPETNAFGQTFRDYNAESERKKTVEEFYRNNHIHQSYAFVKSMREEYGKLNRVEMSIWECIELLNEFVDESDPDLDEPQIEHLLQTAEAIRKDYPQEDWLHLTGLIHDLGKVLLHPSFGELPQWAVVGDTFPVGCAFDESNVHHKFFEGNSDYHNPMYNTKYGVYSEGCGLENVLMSWGHDDYMYLVAKENKTTLPSAALFIIRYHSFYPLHRFGAYSYLMNEEDKENLKWLHVFNKYDLYSKSKVRIDAEKVKPYYLSLIEKYFPAKLKW